MIWKAHYDLLQIAGDISEIAGDLAISEQSVKKIIIPALAYYDQLASHYGVLGYPL